MIAMEDVAILAAESSRSRAYLHLLAQADLRPAACLMVIKPASPFSPGPGSGLFDNTTPVAEAAARLGCDVCVVYSDDVNSPEVVEAVAALPQTLFVFSGPGGSIVKAPLFDTGKKFLHVHPGRVPEYRGSTTIYYSLLAEDKIGATAFLLDKGIDSGPVVEQEQFAPPADRTLIDTVYDSYIRARLLTRVLTRYVEGGGFSLQPQLADDSQPYFIIHPVLKHIAILAGSDADRT